MARELVKVRHRPPGMGEQIPFDQAERFVRRGMAEWTSEKRKKIRFVPSHQRDSAETEALARQSEESRYYNGSDVLTRAQIQGLPMVMPDRALIIPKKMRSTVHRNGNAKALVVDGVEMTLTIERSSSKKI